VGDAMQEVSAGAAAILNIEFGFDLDHLYVKVAGAQPLREMVSEDQHITVNFLRPEGCRVVVSRSNGAVRAQLVEKPRTGNGQGRNCPDMKVAAGRLLELQVPFQCLGVASRSTVAFIVALNRGGSEVEHHPRHQAIEVEVPDERFPARNWTA